MEKLLKCKDFIVIDFPTNLTYFFKPFHTGSLKRKYRINFLILCRTYIQDYSRPKG